MYRCHRLIPLKVAQCTCSKPDEPLRNLNIYGQWQRCGVGNTNVYVRRVLLPDAKQ